MSGTLTAEEKQRIEQALTLIEDPAFVPKLLFMLFDKDVEKDVQNELKAIISKLEEYELEDNKINVLYHQIFEELKKLESAHTQEPTAALTEYLESTTKKATSYIYPNDKTANSLQKLSVNGETTGIIEIKRKNKEVFSYVTLDFDNAVQLTDLKKKNIHFSEFDQQIHEAVVSLMLAGNEYISDYMIYKTLTQSGGHTTPPKWAQSIKESMHKFSSVYITVNFDEITKYYPALKNIDAGTETVDKSGTVRTKLLMFSEIQRKTKNGSKVFVYKILDEPILYTIANAKKQVGSIPIKALENEKLKNTPENTVLKNFLLKRIDQIKHEKLSNNILFDMIYKKTGKQTKDEQRTVRNNVDMMLLQFKANGIISDYEIINAGRKPIKINIIL